MTIVGVVATVAFGVPGLVMARRGNSHPGYPGGIKIQQVSNIRVRDSHDVHNNFRGGTNETDWDELITMVVGVLLVSSLFWLVRLYLVVLLTGLLVGAALLLWTGQRFVGQRTSANSSVVLTAACVLAAVDLVLLAYPGLTWGSGWQLRWSFSLAMHTHGLGFVIEPLLVLVATLCAILILLARSLAPVAASWRDRSARKRIQIWAWVEAQLASIGWHSGAPWFALGFTFVAVTIAVGFPHLGAGHVARTVGASALR
jgi:hypothetical protein